MRTGLFLCEGSSDAPLGQIIASLFSDRGINLRVISPDFALLNERVAKTIEARIQAGMRLIGYEVDVIICHRDADNQGSDKRRAEMTDALIQSGYGSRLVPVIPIRMTEAWLLLDESAIRTVAGSPKGKVELGLPKLHQVEGLSNPKAVLQAAILQAADVTGRRRIRLDQRFSSNRRQLLERLDPAGPVAELSSWQLLVSEINEISKDLLA